MRSLALATILATACTPTQARRAHRVGEIGLATGLIGVLASVTGAAVVTSQEDTLLTVGLAFVPVALVGALLYVSTDKLASGGERPNAMTRHERQQAAAWELTKQAATAARSEDCTQVQAIAPRVRDLDQDFHVSVFMRDAAIQRCMRER